MRAQQNTLMAAVILASAITRLTRQLGPVLQVFFQHFHEEINNG